MKLTYPEVSSTKEWKEGRRFERRRILKLIKGLLPKYYEDGADEFARQLEFALGVENE